MYEEAPVFGAFFLGYNLPMSIETVLLCILSVLALVSLAVQLAAAAGRKRRERSDSSARDSMEALRASIEGRFDAMDARNAQFREGQLAALDRIRSDNLAQMDSMLKRTDRLTETLERNMQALRNENTAQLDRMRKTVDEQLKDTLETRLTQSFEQVQKQLESVYKGLGEMQNLAKSVGDLSRIFSNVKSRGVWGEVQAQSILDDILSSDQYVKNFHPRPKSQEVVEFAIRLPGKSEEDNVYLPIDSKFPREDFDNYQKAQEEGDIEKIKYYQAAMKNRVLSEARDIHDKYIVPPRTTDFAILFLPSESIYAEVLSIAGFAEELQSRYRVTLAGPTTLAALVNSLQMGFRTLAVEKRSHEVWKLFSQMKKQFTLFASSLDAAGRSLGSAVNKIEDVSNRSARISHKLDSIELPVLDENAENIQNMLE